MDADCRRYPPAEPRGNEADIEPVLLDISNAAAVEDCVATWQPQAIVHLASVVAPPPGMSEAQMHAIDVDGTQALIQAAVDLSDGSQIILF